MNSSIFQFSKVTADKAVATGFKFLGQVSEYGGVDNNAQSILLGCESLRLTDCTVMGSGYDL